MISATLKKQYWILGAIVGVFVVINFIGFWFFMRPGLPPGTFAGTVSSTSSSTIVILDGKQHMRTFAITPTTKFFHGKTEATTTNIAAGTFVFISTASPTTQTVATKVRILSTNPFDHPKKIDKPETP